MTVQMAVQMVTKVATLNWGDKTNGRQKQR